MHDRPNPRAPLIRIRRLALLIGATFATVALATESASPPEAQAEAAATKNPNQLICKRETTTGSFIPKKTCKTQAQIDKEQANSKRWMEENHRNSSWSTTSTEGGMVITPPHP